MMCAHNAYQQSSLCSASAAGVGHASLCLRKLAWSKKSMLKLVECHSSWISSSMSSMQVIYARAKSDSPFVLAAFAFIYSFVLIEIQACPHIDALVAGCHHEAAKTQQLLLQQYASNLEVA